MRALELSAGNLSGAARMLGISRDTVRYRMGKHRVRVEARVVVGPGGPRLQDSSGGRTERNAR